MEKTAQTSKNTSMHERNSDTTVFLPSSQTLWSLLSQPLKFGNGLCKPAAGSLGALQPVPPLLVLRVRARVDDAVHVQVQVVELHLVGVGPGGVDRDPDAFALPPLWKQAGLRDASSLLGHFCRNHKFVDQTNTNVCFPVAFPF